MYLGNTASSKFQRSSSQVASQARRHFRTNSLFAPIHGASASFETGTNSTYFETMHEAWKEDPNSVHPSWRSYFEGLESGVAEPFQMPPTLGMTARQQEIEVLKKVAASGAQGSAHASSRDVSDTTKVM